MKNMTIANSNSKGQIVLPASMRKALNIDEHVSLLITLRGKTIQIEPILSVSTVGEITSKNILEILQSTQGAWHDDSPDIDDIIRKRELAATARRKQSW